MLNEHIGRHCQLIRKKMLLIRELTLDTSAPIQGSEREIFINNLLSLMLPTAFRVGTGEVIDSYGHKSKQTDIVVECPFGARFPIGTGNANMYLAENVAFTIEVKSDISSEWDDITVKSTAMRKITRALIPPTSSSETMVPKARMRVPIFIVSYTGNKKMETIIKHLEEIAPASRPDGILVVDSGLYWGSTPSGVIEATGDKESVWAFIMHITECMQYYSTSSWNMMSYVKANP